MNTYIRNDNKIYFGTYPQKLINDNNLIVRLNELAGKVPLRDNKYNWSDFNYYVNGKQTSYMYYQDIEINNIKYRGVYFKEYRPKRYSNGSLADNSLQDKNGYLIKTIYWFSYDLIEWNILTESNDEALILANLILDSQDYYQNNSTDEFSHNGGTGYANNYALSNIRKFLNETFYNTAFNDLQKVLIEKITVDNSASTTGNSSNGYACDNTEDKLFLLSNEEASSIYYFSNKNARQSMGSDYAKCQGLWVSASRHSPWWLRSPNYCEASSADCVYGNGFIDGDDVDVGFNGNGVRPACWIRLR